MGLVDLSLTFVPGMLGVEFEPRSRFAEKRYNTTMLHLYSHTGTHVDAPLHFIDEGKGMEAVDLHKCVGPALVIDLSHKAPSSFITPEDLQPYAERITAGSRLLLRTDWDLRAEHDDYRTHFPRISLALAAWLAARAIWLLGVETPSVASLLPDNREELIAVHSALLGAEIVIVESLARLRDLRGAEVEFIALPLKLAGIDGSPVRAVAFDSAAD
jgi:kynurenine formamidase